MAERERQSKRALWVAFALVAAYLVVPDTAGASEFTSIATCAAPPATVCDRTANPESPAGDRVEITGVLTSKNQVFVVSKVGSPTITSVEAVFNDSATPVPQSTSFPITFLDSTSTHYVKTLTVKWNDNLTSTTSSSTSTIPGASTSSTSSTTSSSTSSTTTTSTIAPGPGNGPIAPRPEGGLDSPGGADATAVRGADRVDVVTSRNGNIQGTTWDGSSWSSWADLSKPIFGYKGDPTVVSWAPGRLDVFARGGDDKLWQRFSTNGGASWSDWIKPVGDNGTLASPPDASTRGPNTLDIWALGTDGNVYQLWWDGTTWNGWLGQGRPAGPGVAGGSHPTAISRDGTRVDVFVRGGDNKLWQRTWSGFDWSSWVQPVGDAGTLNSSPDATSWDTTNLVVFIIGTDQHLYALPFGTGGWGTYVRLAGQNANFTDNPGATSRGPSRFDAFGRGTDGLLYQIWQ